MDEVSTFVGEVARSLRAGVVNRLCSFSFVVRSDVFVFHFGGKGRACPHRLGRFFLTKQIFDLEYFPHDCFICCDRLGDSCRINFPVRIYSKILWSPVTFTQDTSNAVVPKKDRLKSCVM